MRAEIAAPKANACVAKKALRWEAGGKARRNILRTLSWLFLGSVVILLAVAVGEATSSSAWKTYTREDYGFGFSYPGDWSLFEHLNPTRYLELGLPAVFNLCLTSQPVRDLACELEIYVIPKAKFVPPSEGNFLGLAYNANKDGSFVTKDSINHEAWLNHYVSHNGFVYLWAHRGGQVLTFQWSQIVNSFRYFFQPQKPTWPSFLAPPRNATVNLFRLCPLS